MGFFDDTSTEYHSDGSYTERNATTGSSATYDSHGNLMEYSTTEIPLFGSDHVNTYDKDGHLVNTQPYEKNK